MGEGYGASTLVFLCKTYCCDPPVNIPARVTKDVRTVKS